MRELFLVTIEEMEKNELTLEEWQTLLTMDSLLGALHKRSFTPDVWEPGRPNYHRKRKHTDPQANQTLT